MSVIAAKSSAKVVPFEFRFLSFGSDAKYLGNMLSQISQWICCHISYNDGFIFHVHMLHRFRPEEQTRKQYIPYEQIFIGSKNSTLINSKVSASCCHSIHFVSFC